MRARSLRTGVAGGRLDSPSVEILENTVRDYAWGSPTGIPEILGVEPDGRPWAELWIGAHTDSPSLLAGGRRLDDHLRAHPEALGRSSVDRYGDRLPFLLKILSAGAALSIQAHPTLSRAREGFAEEEAAGVPVDAPHRNYKDAWHKPELIHALTPFTALCGYRPIAAVRATVARLSAAVDAAGGSERESDLALLREWDAALALPGEDRALAAATALLLGTEGYGGLTARLAALDLPEAPATDPSRAGSDADPVATLRLLEADFPADPGALVGVMLGRVTLLPGQSLALDAGVPHAYLRGLGVEIMASSDNVLRGGLTPKHIDLEELDRVLVHEVSAPELVTPDADGVVRGATEDFALQRIDEATDRPVHRSGAAVILCTAGAFTVRSGEAEVPLTSGTSVFVGADEPQPVVSGSGQLFVASTGLPQ